MSTPPFEDVYRKKYEAKPAHLLLDGPGQLWQGGWAAPLEVDECNYDLIILAAKDYQPEIILAAENAPAVFDGSGYPSRIFVRKLPQIIRLDLWDYTYGDLDKTEEAKILQIGRETAKVAADALHRTSKVLSNCWGGINRSGLISSLILKEQNPALSFAEIIHLIRRHIPFASSNPYWRDFLLNLDR